MTYSTLITVAPGSSFLDSLEGLDLTWRILAAFAMPLGETMLFLEAIAPGEIGLGVLGAATGLNIGLVAIYLAASSGAFLGNTVSWWLGNRFGLRVLTRWPLVWRHVEPTYQRAERLLDRHGVHAVIIGQFLGPLRALLPAAAGTAGMTYRRFAIANAAAVATWVGVVLIVGAVAGRAALETIESIGIRVAGGAAILALLIAATRIVRTRKSDMSSSEQIS